MEQDSRAGILEVSNPMAIHRSRTSLSFRWWPVPPARPSLAHPSTSRPGWMC